MDLLKLHSAHPMLIDLFENDKLSIKIDFLFQSFLIITVEGNKKYFLKDLEFSE